MLAVLEDPVRRGASARRRGVRGDCDQLVLPIAGVDKGVDKARGQVLARRVYRCSTGGSSPIN